MFKLEAVLGEGTFGTVYKVKCLQTTLFSGDSGQRIIVEHKTPAQAKRKLKMMQEGGVNLNSDGRSQKSLV